MSIIMLDTICELEAVDKFGLVCFTIEVRPEKVEQSNTWGYFTYPVTVEKFEKFKIFSYLVFPRFVNAFMDCPFC